MVAVVESDVIRHSQVAICRPLESEAISCLICLSQKAAPCCCLIHARQQSNILEAGKQTSENCWGAFRSAVKCWSIAADGMIDRLISRSIVEGLLSKTGSLAIVIGGMKGLMVYSSCCLLMCWETTVSNSKKNHIFRWIQAVSEL